jgi:diadenylate cyclase
MSFDGLLHMFSGRSPLQIAIDVLDVIVVSVVIYRMLLVLKGTRAAQIGVGFLLVFLTYLAARWLGLVTLESLFSWLLSSAILLIIIVFQNDIRRALHRIGANPLFSSFGHGLEERVVDEVVAATTELARHRIGAIIAFEQQANLDEFLVGQGTVLDSSVTKELLVTMFIPESVNKLHDGAVIIRNLRIAKAGVFFPLPEARNVDPSHGSRHRAAMGITEETDAVVIVVSEERGTISFCFNGNIVSDINGDVLRKTLLRIFGRAVPKKKDKKAAARERDGAVAGRVAIATPLPPRTSVVPTSGAVPNRVAITPAPESSRTPKLPTTPLASPVSTPVSTTTSTPMPTSVSTPVDRGGGSTP